MQLVIIALISLSMFAPQDGCRPADNWRVLPADEDTRRVSALLAAPCPDDVNFPVFYTANQINAGRIESGNSSDSRSGQIDLIAVLQDIFRDEGVPHNLAWLAEVESALNPNAESKVGAVGLFQLMPATAERFGLQLFPVDDRKTPDKSARAAACYLRQLYKEFGGWALALAAYNAGEGRVSRTMKSHNARTFREVAPHLPSETRKYVPRVMSVIALREDQSRGVSAAVYMP